MSNTYTEDDRKEALKLAKEIGVTPASQRLGISLKTLYCQRRNKNDGNADRNLTQTPL
jgi:transposase-like protein